jgi:hypothetical protein
MALMTRFQPVVEPSACSLRIQIIDYQQTSCSSVWVTPWINEPWLLRGNAQLFLEGLRQSLHGDEVWDRNPESIAKTGGRLHALHRLD